MIHAHHIQALLSVGHPIIRLLRERLTQMIREVFSPRTITRVAESRILKHPPEEMNGELGLTVEDERPAPLFISLKAFGE